MGKHGRAWKFGAACLAGLALSAPWTVMSSPADRTRGGDDAANAPPAVQLDFSDFVPEIVLGQIPKDLLPPPPRIIESAKVPAAIPGAGEAPFPKLDPLNPRANEELLGQLYPPLPPVGSVTPPDLGPEGRPLSLDDLQRYAEANNPSIRQAAVDAPAAGGRHFESVFQARQKNAKAIAAVESQLVDAALTRVRAEVFAGVRHGYFAVLAAQERMRVQEAFTRFADDAYRVQVERAKTGQALPAEPLQFRAIAYRARAELVQARNAYLSSWKQLAAAVGRLDLRPALLDGRIDRPLPLLDFEAVHGTVVSRNSEIAAAQYAIDKAQIALGATTAAPFAYFRRDEAARARADLARLEDEPARARARLTAQLTQAFERYDNQRRILVYYRDNIIPDQVNAYRDLAGRPYQGSEIPSRGDLVLAQQSLATSLTTYLQALEEAWFAVTEIGRLLQARDLFNIGNEAIVTQLAYWNALPSCQAGSAAMNWPEVMLTNQAAAANGPRLIQGPRPAHSAIRSPNDNLFEMPVAPARALPQPVSGSALLAPLASIERSTKRRKIFSWPAWRGDGSAPLMLPQADDAAPCAPAVETPQAASLPQPMQDPAPAIQRSEPPAAPAEPRLQPAAFPSPPPLPQIIEAPVEPRSRGPRTAGETSPQVILIEAVVPPPPSALQGTPPLLIDPYFPEDISYLPEPAPPLRLSSLKK